MSLKLEENDPIVGPIKEVELMRIAQRYSFNKLTAFTFEHPFLFNVSQEFRGRSEYFLED